MSAFLCGDKMFKALAKYATTTDGFQCYNANPSYIDGMPVEAKTMTRLQLANLYSDILYMQNARSVSARYREDKSDERVEITKHDIDDAVPCLPMVQILKFCNCLEYQSCETEDWKQTLAFRLLYDIKESAIRDLPGYSEAEWAA